MSLPDGMAFSLMMVNVKSPWPPLTLLEVETETLRSSFAVSGFTKIPVLFSSILLEVEVYEVTTKD